jgi:hypothetical protein
MLREFEGPGVVKCFGITKVNELPALVLEYCKYNSLSYYMKK